MKRTLQLVFAVAMTTMFAQAASAASITFVGSSGGLVAATRITDIGGGVLRIELGNFGSAAVIPVDVLTGVMFDGNNAVLSSLGNISAFTSSTTTITNPNSCGAGAAACPNGANLNVGGEFASAANPLGVYDFGISSSGLGIFGQGNFIGPDLSNPTAVNGLNFGMVSIPNGISGGANPQVLSQPLLRGVVTFNVQGQVGFNPATGITGVRFQYGTALTDANFIGTPLPPGVPTPFDVGPTAVPEPASLMLMGSGLLFGARSMRKRFSK
jgi:hypothetical protein